MVDPILAPVAADLLWRSLLDVAKYIVRADTEADARRNLIAGNQVPDDTLAEALRIASQRLTEPPAIDPAIGGESLREFLESPDARSLVRQIYASTLTSTPLPQLEEQFVVEIELWTGSSTTDAELHGGRLFRAFADICREVLDQAIARNVLAAHEATSSLRHRLLSEQLEGIDRHVAALVDSKKASHTEILAFERTYRKQVGNRESHVIPPNLDRNTKVPIDDLYVPPRLRRHQAHDTDPTSYSAFIDEIDRTVILGDPGAGKSTLTIKLCHDLSARRSQHTYRNMDITPILVILRDYGAIRKTHGSSILEFIETTARSKYQVPTVPAGAFDYLLQSGRALVIFDGLDELLDSSYRQVVSGDVETFAALYSASPILVTSRRIGYEQAPLDPHIFETFSMAEFDEQQVEAYARNWFAIDTGLSPEERDSKVTGFVRESLIVPDLRANPLMLGLMCNLYGGANYIPANRPDVYEKCAVMLFERWDPSRGITVEVPFESRLRPAMQHLAHWIYLDEALQSGVTRSQLVDEAARYLYPRQFDDEAVAREAASQFVDVCKGRAWVFTDTGLAPNNELLFQFTHRTFLEYFCADYLARRYSSPEALLEALAPRIEQREWDVVSQLAMQIKTRYVEDAEDEMLNVALNRATLSSDQVKTNLLLFAARSLEFLVPSPRCVDEVVRACVAEAVLIASSADQALGGGPSRPTNPMDTAAELLSTLGLAGKETWPTVIKGLEGALGDTIVSGETAEASFACEIAYHADSLLQAALGRSDRDDRYRQLSEAGRRTVSACLEQCRRLAAHDPLLKIDAVIAGLEPASALVNGDSCEQLFAARELRVFRSTFSIPVAPASVLGAMSTEDRWYWWPQRDHFVAILSEVGKLLGECPPPWIRDGQPGFPWLSPDLALDLGLLTESNARFALLATVSLSIELEEHGGAPWPLSESDTHPPLRDSLESARSSREVSTSVEALTLGLDEDQSALLQAWCRGEVDLAVPPVDGDDVGATA